MNDILHNRVDANLKQASSVMLVSLPEDQSATPDEFLAMQNKTSRTRARVDDQVGRGAPRVRRDRGSHRASAFQRVGNVELDADETAVRRSRGTLRA